MDFARRRRLRWTAGILASLAFNGLLLSLVAFQTPAIRSVPDRDEQKAIRATLIVLPKPGAVAARSRKPPASPSPAHAPPPPVEKTAAAAPVAATKPSPPSAVPDTAADNETEVRERVGRALRGMAACARFDAQPQDRQRPPCGKSWAAPGLAIDPVSSAMRAQVQAETSRSGDAVRLGDRFRNDLFDHKAQGNNAHFGCAIDTGGKVKCSTY